MGLRDKWNIAVDFVLGREVKADNVTNLRPNRSTSLIKYDIPLTRIKQDVGRWRRALISAESILNPSRTELYRIYKDVLLDAHLSSVIEQRQNAVLCRKIYFYKQDGTVDEEQTKRFQKSWFRKQNKFILDSRQMGFNLVDYGPLVDDTFPTIDIVPHQYVKPELGIVVANTSDINGTPIDDPKYAKWNLFFGETRDLGLLMKATPWTLWKKAVVAYWSEYCEKFGMPMRTGKTNIHDETLKANMENALKNMGSAFWAIMNTDDNIELLETFNTAAYDIYDKFIERANSEISKLELCQTGTTDEKSFVGSANVHQDILSDVVEAECCFLMENLNEKVIPFLNNLGFALPEGGYFGMDYKEAPDIKTKADIVASFMPYVKFDQKYLEDEFGIVIEEMGDLNKQQAGGAGEKKSLTNYQNITDSYSSICKTCGGYHNEKEEFNLFSETEKEELINGIAAGVYSTQFLPEWYYTKVAEAITAEVRAGFDIEVVLGESDTLLLQELTTNVYAFSAAKTYQQVRDIQALLIKYPQRTDLFIKAASAIFDDYNKNWLATEMVTAKGTARSAKNWNAIERDKYVLKYLEYQTVGDSRVRPTHAELDGITRPVDDQFWDSYYPPNGWRCRCSTISHEDVKSLTPMKGFTKPEDVPDIFLFNPGKDKIIFSPEHPYFKVAKGDKQYALNNFNLPLPNGAQ